MVNRKNKQKKRKGMNPVTASRSHDKLVHGVCALTDPFCIEAKGARWADQIGQTVTFTYQARQIISLTTGVGDSWAAVYIDPAYALNSVAPGAYYRTLDVDSSEFGGFTPANPTTGNVDDQLASFLASDVATGARVVSAGATWWDVAPRTGVGGTVVATEFSSHDSYLNYASSGMRASATNMGNCVMVHDRRKDGTWICRPSNPNAYKFVSIGDSADDNFGNLRTSLLVAASGAAETTLLNIEIVINFEFTVSSESVFARTAKPNPMSAGNLLAAKSAGMAESSMNSFIEGGKETAKRYVHSLASRVAKQLGSAAAGYVGTLMGGPVGGVGSMAAYGAIMDVD